ncbi:TOBE domain-containing protein, partial [Streptomyces sp. NPDC006992]|uniref:TOBE domain-containing protein n=1 Tax=Streptomyces sp. NPDC006992 TaxID=3155601 RepID=UPI003409A76A
RERPHGSPRNVRRGTVREITAVGSRLRVLVAAQPGTGGPAAEDDPAGGPAHGPAGGGPDLVAEITAEAAAELGLADGAEVFTSVKATEITLVER